MDKRFLFRLSLRVEIVFVKIMFDLRAGKALGLSVYFSQRSSMHFALSYIVHCNSLVCDSNTGARCFIFSPNLGAFCFSLGVSFGRGFIQIGAFIGCPPVAGPVGLAVAVAPSAGSVEGRFSMLMGSTDSEVVFDSIGRVRLVRRSILFAVD